MDRFLKLTELRGRKNDTNVEEFEISNAERVPPSEVQPSLPPVVLDEPGAVPRVLKNAQYNTGRGIGAYYGSVGVGGDVTEADGRWQYPRFGRFHFRAILR